MWGTDSAGCNYCLVSRWAFGLGLVIVWATVWSLRRVLLPPTSAGPAPGSDEWGAQVKEGWHVPGRG